MSKFQQIILNILEILSLEDRDLDIITRAYCVLKDNEYNENLVFIIKHELHNLIKLKLVKKEERKL
ncbi:MAG: hypothetical protein ACFFAH_08985 [Promethearchaeota archaeon]